MASGQIASYQSSVEPKIAEFLSASEGFGGSVAEQAGIFGNAFREVIPKYVALSYIYSLPAQADAATAYKPVSDALTAIGGHVDKAKPSDADYNKLKAVQSASEAVTWISGVPKPHNFIKECSDQSLFYINRVRKDGTDADKAWAKALLQLMTALGEFVKDNFSAGLLWHGKAKIAAGAADASLADLTSRASNAESDTSSAPKAAVSGDGDSAAYISECGPKIDAFVAASATFGDVVPKVAGLFAEAAKDEVAKYIDQASNFAAPTPADQPKVFKSLADKVAEITKVTESNNRDKYFNCLQTMKAGSEAFSWVCAPGRPFDFVKECADQAMFYANRVRKDGGDPEKEWVKAFLQVMGALQSYVKDYHPSGLLWKGAAKHGPAPAAAGGAPPPPPPGGAPPPPPPGDFAGSAPSGGAAKPDMSGLFAQLNSGEGVTAGLKKVTKDMQTHKNPNLRGAGVVSASAVKSSVGVDANAKVAPKVKKPPRLELEQDKKWAVEYHTDASLTVEVSSMKQSVYIYGCTGSTIVVKGKVNSITVDNSKKCGVVFDDLLASVDVVNSKSIQIQALAHMPLLNIDKTDGAQVYLSKDCLNCEIVSAKSSEMNVLVPQEDGDFSEFPIPEQFRTIYNAKTNKLVTSASESLG